MSAQFNSSSYNATLGYLTGYEPDESPLTYEELLEEALERKFHSLGAFDTDPDEEIEDEMDDVFEAYPQGF